MKWRPRPRSRSIILARNLFERTADIGFLATDDDIRSFIAVANGAHKNFNAERELRPRREALRRRFAEYTAKYSVYSDIILLDTEGHVLARLDDGIEVERSSDALVRAALEFGPRADSTRQQSLPRDGSGQIRTGSFGAFVDCGGSVVACTNERYGPGDKLPLASDFLELANGEGKASIVRFENSYYALGARMSSGYREYKGASDAYRNDIIALVFVPLCEALDTRQRETIPPPRLNSDRPCGRGRRYRELSSRQVLVRPARRANRRST